MKNCARILSLFLFFLPIIIIASLDDLPRDAQSADHEPEKETLVKSTPAERLPITFQREITREELLRCLGLSVTDVAKLKEIDPEEVLRIKEELLNREITQEELDQLRALLRETAENKIEATRDKEKTIQEIDSRKIAGIFVISTLGMWGLLVLLFVW